MAAIFWTTCLLMTLMTSPSGESEIIVRPGPSSGVMVQETPGFILTDRRLKTQKVCTSVNPQPFIEKRFDITTIKSPEIKLWYDLHLTRTQKHVTELLTQASKPFTSVPTLQGQRPKRFVGAIMAGLVFSILGTVVATSVSSVNTVSVKILEAEMESLRHNMDTIRKQLQIQRDGLSDLMTVVNDTVVTLNLHSELIARSINLHQSHEIFKQELLFMQEPIISHTNSLINEIQHSMDHLTQGRIPIYFVSEEMIKVLLTEETGDAVTDFQIHLAFEMGSAIPLYIDPQEANICFLLTIPYISSTNVFQMKTVHNVGTWKDNIHVHIQTPDIIAYQPWNQKVFMIPILNNCLRFKDNNFQCNGNPFVYDVTQALCGVEYQKHGLEKCEVHMRRSDDQDEVKAILVNDEWLVSTTLKNLSIFYKDHVVNRNIMIPTPVSLIKVPPNARITIGKSTLYPVGVDTWNGEVENIDPFQNITIPINPDLQFLLEHKPNHTLHMLIKKDNLTIDTYDYTSADTTLLKERDGLLPHNFEIYLIMGIIIVWLIILSIMIGKTMADGNTQSPFTVRFLPV